MLSNLLTTPSAMPSTKPNLNVHRVVDIDDLTTATLNAVLRENRGLGGALASAAFGAGLTIAGGALLALDFVHVVSWPIEALATVSGAIGAGVALTALGTWQWRKGDKRLRKLEAKLYASWYLQREIDAAPVAAQEPLPTKDTQETQAPEAFGRKHVIEAQQKAEELLRRVMQRKSGSN
jgi:hypothetical protein